MEFKVPAPTHGPGRDNPYKTAYEAITFPPIATDADNHQMPVHTERVKKFLSYIPEGQNAWSQDIPEELRLNVKNVKMSQIYRRLDRNSPSYTVTGSGGGGTHMYHWSENRALTSRERARLQTFPDNYVFYGTKEKVRQQIGMAVPPDGAKAIIEAVLKTYAGIQYKSIQAKWDIDHLLRQTSMELVTL
jgi:DNA (cytosine-5)-methyltransferase 1